MIDRSHALPIARQAKALNISRGSVYYLPRPVSATDLAVMHRMDELHLDFPFAGSRMLRDLLNADGVEIGRLHVATLMKRMGIEAIYRKPNTSKPAPGHKIYPYLLRKMQAVRLDQVWAMDITYIPMARGFVYLAAVVDWFSRRVLSHRVSITMEADFCIEALEEALARHGRPEIFNTDPRSILRNARNVTVRLDEVIGVEPVRRQILLRAGGSLAYNYLVLATGVEYDYFGHDTWTPFAPSLSPLAGRSRLLGLSRDVSLITRVVFLDSGDNTQLAF